MYFYKKRVLNRNITTLLALLFILLGLAYFVYNKAEEDALAHKSNLSFIPSEDTFLIIESNDISEQIQKIFSSNLIWADFSKKDTLFNKIEENINFCDSVFEQKNIKLKNSVLAFIQKDSNVFDFLLVSSLKDSSLTDSLIETSKNSYITIALPQDTLYITTKNDRLICSNNTHWLNIKSENAIEKDSSFMKVYNTKALKNNPLFLYANLERINRFNKLNLANYLLNSSWSAFDIKISQDEINGNGFVVNNNLNNISENYTESFFNITPSAISNLSVVNFNSLNEIDINPQLIKKNNEECNCDFLFDGLNWIDKQIINISTTLHNANFTAFKFTDINSFNVAINQLSDSVTNQHFIDSLHVIKSFKSDINLGEVFGTKNELNHYTFYNDYVIFGSNIEDLKRLIYLLNNNQTFKKNEDLYDFYTANSSENSFYKKVQKGFLFNANLAENGVSILESSVKDDNLVYTNFSYSKEISIGGSYHTPKWELFFDNPIIKSIHFVKNHKINDIDILVEDTANTIYLLSTSGSIKWKRKISGSIIGNVSSIDIYKNGKYQMLFNTSSKLYIVDVLGRDVENFPVKLNLATNPVSCIDYDKNGDYRFLVSTSQGILNFNKEGKQIEGWKKPKTKSILYNPIRHLLANTKDYLFVNDSLGKVYLFSRQGDIRHSVSSSFVSDYFPIDMGNTIEESRAIYWDRKLNQLKKHFFNNEISTIITLPDSVIKFHYLDFYPDKKEKNYVLETANEIYVYDKGGNTLEIIQISPEHKNLNITKNYIAYINSITNDFVLLDKKGNEILRSSNVSYFNIDNSSSKTRILLLNNNKLQMIIPNK